MNTLYVYGDFDWLERPQLIGELGYESLRGSDSYSFIYLNSADCLLAYFKSMLRSYFSQYFSYKTFFLPASYLIVHYQVQNPPPK